MSDPQAPRITGMTDKELLKLHRHEMSLWPISVLRVGQINGEFLRRGYTIIEEEGKQDRFVKGKVA